MQFSQPSHLSQSFLAIIRSLKFFLLNHTPAQNLILLKSFLFLVKFKSSPSQTLSYSHFLPHQRHHPLHSFCNGKRPRGNSDVKLVSALPNTCVTGGADAQHVQATRRPRGTLDLLKCEDCRRRKVKCTPQGRRWPEKCDQCWRMDLSCSPSRAADRTRKRKLQVARQTNSPIQDTILITPDVSESIGFTNQSVESVVGAQHSDIDYRDLRDAAVFLHLHYQELMVKERQAI